MKLSNLEGYQFSYAIIDEFHEAKDKKMYETLRRGQVLLNNPSLIIISTAGFNLYGGPMFEEYKYINKVLEGTELMKTTLYSVLNKIQRTRFINLKHGLNLIHY
jgi:phage terminase large subunit-like protein